MEVAEKLPPPELTWLFTHCRAIGMKHQSDSGQWEHDIALFTVEMRDLLDKAEAALASCQKELQSDWTACTAASSALIAIKKWKGV